MMCPVGVGDPRAALEGNVIVLGGAEMVEIVQVGNLVRPQTEDGIGIHQDGIVPVRTSALDAGAGDVVGVPGQAVLLEQRGAGGDQLLVEEIDVLDVNPGAQAVPGQRGPVVGQCVDQPVEDLACLFC